MWAGPHTGDERLAPERTEASSARSLGGTEALGPIEYEPPAAPAEHGAATRAPSEAPAVPAAAPNGRPSEEAAAIAQPSAPPEALRAELPPSLDGSAPPAPVDPAGDPGGEQTIGCASDGPTERPAESGMEPGVGGQPASPADDRPGEPRLDRPPPDAGEVRSPAPAFAPVAAGRWGNWSLGTVRGVPLHLHYSLLIALPVYAFFAEGQMRAAVTLATATGASAFGSSWTWALLLTGVLAVGLALHQVGHAVAARVAGGRLGEVRLMLLGGCGRVDLRPGPNGPARLISVAAAGPATLLVAGGALCLVGSYLASSRIDLHYALIFAGQTQVALGLLDLIPSPPLDGSRILVALLQRRLGRLRAIRYATRIGKGLAALCALVGTVAASALSIALAAVLWAGAEQAASGVGRSEALRGVTVRAALGPPPWPLAWIDAGATVAALSARMCAQHLTRFAVAEAGTVVGVATARDVARVPVEERTVTLVRDVAHAVPTVALGAPVAEAGAILRAVGARALPVVENGELVALLSDLELAAAEELGRIALRREPNRAN